MNKNEKKGQTILGPTENIKSIQRQDLLNYVHDHYKGSRMVLAGAGGIDHDKLVKLAEEHLGKMCNTYDQVDIPKFDGIRYTGSEVRIRDDDMPFIYAAIAIEGAGWENPDNIPLMVANTVSLLLVII